MLHVNKRLTANALISDLWPPAHAARLRLKALICAGPARQWRLGLCGLAASYSVWRTMERDPARKRRVRLALAEMMAQSTQKSLMEILRIAQEHPEAALASRMDMWRTSQELISDLKITFEVPMATGKPFQWVLLHPGRMVTKMVQECGKEDSA